VWRANSHGDVDANSDALVDGRSASTVRSSDARTAALPFLICCVVLGLWICSICGHQFREPWNGILHHGKSDTIQKMSTLRLGPIRILMAIIMVPI
jgi:hypothetical protein